MGPRVLPPGHGNYRWKSSLEVLRHTEKVKPSLNTSNLHTHAVKGQEIAPARAAWRRIRQFGKTGSSLDRGKLRKDPEESAPFRARWTAWLRTLGLQGETLASHFPAGVVLDAPASMQSCNDTFLTPRAFLPLITSSRRATTLGTVMKDCRRCVRAFIRSC